MPCGLQERDGYSPRENHDAALLVRFVAAPLLDTKPRQVGRPLVTDALQTLQRHSLLGHLWSLRACFGTHREALKGIAAPTDMIILSDLDEIPRAATVERLTHPRA